MSTLLQIQGLSRHFRLRNPSGFGGRVLRAVDGVSFDLQPGQTLGLVGESGCGKSTLGRMIVGLMPPSGGQIMLSGQPLQANRSLSQRRAIQMVFQDPYASLDPRMRVRDIIAEPLRIHGRDDPARVARLLDQVGLPADAADRLPADFSGGQRQRIAIARALALEPSVLILDEAVSALDVSIQAQIVNLLRQLQRDLGLAYLFISHDLSVVRHISDRVAVMYLGRIVEHGPRDAVFDTPAHPYTQALLSAVPDPRNRARKGRIVLRGDLPGPALSQPGCAFASRCFRAEARCHQAAPDTTPTTDGSGRIAACHFSQPRPREALALPQTVSDKEEIKT
jgi:peptide/nickel transport system ATP-binding protein